MKKLSKIVYLIIVSYNGGQQIIGCLESLKLIDIPKDWQTKILVVDNGSEDDSAKKVGQLQVNGLRVVENSKNLGFAVGCNIGIKEALADNAQAILLLNQDTIVEKDFLTTLLANKADIVGPVIKFQRHGKWRYDFGGKVNLVIGRTRHIENCELRIANCELDYVSGCAMMVRRSVFEKIGLFDERFFLYFEDVDFCLRAKKAGFKISLEPKSIVIHKLTDPRQRKKRQNLYLVKSHLFFINKYICWPHRLLAYVYWLLISMKILFQ